MKKLLLISLAVLALSLAGCKEKPKEMPPAMPQGGMPAGQMPADVAKGGNPHAGMTTMPQEIPAGASHKGKVISTMDAAGYTYIEVEEKGQKLWVAAMQTKLKAGDEVEFADSQPMVNFTSKTLNRTFERIYFVSALRVNGK